ncbi:MAG: caspase family protein [Lewinellaceae bacterium]|nr:caspase family protein [Lewinellaceae bacterium]
MATINALLVAINDYPNPQHRLNGCLNDLDGMLACLEDYCKRHNHTLAPAVLKDQEATRANIIEGFEHLGRAEAGDFCLFFFAGHGSRCKAPKEFWHIEADKMNESLVCWDSRTEGGRDLMDKELSYLIWKTTHNKDVSFISITDCCHSGSNMRLEPIGERRMSKVNTAVPVEQYLGFEHYEKVGEGKYTPPRGRYIHLSACQPHETAKEVKVGGRKRGIFSYLFQKALAGSRSPLSYAELALRTRFHVRHYMEDQYPMLEATEGEDKKQFFLSRQSQQAAAPYLVSHDKKIGWVVNAGGLHGMAVSNGDAKTTFELLDDGRKIELEEVLTDRSTVTGMDSADTSKVYPARLVSQARPPITLAPAPGSDAEGIALLRTLLKEQNAQLVAWGETPEQARYLVHAKGGAYYLTSLQDERPLFKRVHGYSQGNAEDFLRKVEKVAKWIRLQELSHPNSQIPLNGIKVELYKGSQPGNLEDDAPADLADWRAPGLFSHEYPGGVIAKPTFKLRITNQSGERLWASILYLGANYSISNELLPMQPLDSGDEANCSYPRQGRPNRTIPIMLDKTFHSWGITRSYNYLKVILCTAAFDTDGFNQKGLQLEGRKREDTERNLGFEDETPEEDWAIITIPIVIHQPLPLQPLNAFNPAAFFGHLQLKAPEGFSAEVSPTTLEDACRGLKRFPGLEAPSGHFLHPAELGPPESHPGLSVLELRNCKGTEAISGERPLRLQWLGEGGAFPPFEAYGLDRKSMEFFPLRSRWEEKSLFMEELPEGGERGVQVFCFKQR